MNLFTKQKQTDLRTNYAYQGRETDWDFGTSISIVHRMDEHLQQSIGSCIQYPVIIHNGKGYDKECGGSYD